MSDPFDRYNLAARLEKQGDRLMTACEQGEAIENRVDVCNQLNAVCRIAMTLKALRTEGARSADPNAGSAVRKYATEFAVAAEPRRVASTGSGAEAASEPFIDDPCWTDPAEE